MAEQRSQREQTSPPFSPFPGRGGPGARMMGPAPRPKNARATVLRLWGYLRRQRRALIVTALMVVGTTGLNLLGPYLLGRAIDAYILGGDLLGLMRLLLLMAGVYTLTSLLTWLQSYVMAGAAQRAVRDIRNDLFRKMQTLQLRFFDQRAHGDLMSRLTNDVENVNQVLTDGVTQIVSGVLTTVGIAVVMFWINPVLAAVSILTVTLLTLGLNRWVATQTREGFRRQQASLGKLNGLIEETVSGQRVVKAYHKEQAVVEQFGVANGDLRQAATRAQIYAGFVGPLMNFVSNLGLAIVAGVGGLLVLRGLATLGTSSHVHQLHAPVWTPAQRDRQPLQPHPGRRRGRRACVRGDRRGAGGGRSRRAAPRAHPG